MGFWARALSLPRIRINPGKRGFARNYERNYAAANIGRLFADFNASAASADSELLGSLERMRNRARDLERNEPLVRHFLDLLKTNVVGPNGMRLQVKARNQPSGQLDEVGNRIIEEAWDRFCRYGNPTPCGQYSMKTLANLAIVAAARDGEAFFQIIRNRDLVHGFGLHPFEPDLVDERKNVRLPNGNRVRMGVEINQYGRPVAYWVRQGHPGDYQLKTYGIERERRIPASDIIHVKLTRRAGQTRGEPLLVPVITTFKMINGHREAELVASRIAASKMGFFTSEMGDEYPADSTGPDGSPELYAEPGLFKVLPPGMRFEEYNPQHPSTAFADFQRSVLLSTAAGLGISYESLTGDVDGVSYSSLRQVSISERDFYREVQEWFKEQFMRQVFERWLMHVMDFNYIPIPPSRFDKFNDAATFQSRGWKWVDPQKEINAAVDALHAGLISMTEAANEMGHDLEETFAQIEREKQLAAKHGIELAFEPFGATPGKKNEQQAEADAASG
jgi:lambda family phage portal protein